MRCYRPLFFAKPIKKNWYTNIFVSGGVYYPFAVANLGEIVEPHISFSASLGYSYKNFSFALESGFSSFKGKPLSYNVSTTIDSIIVRVDLIPLAASVSYDFVFFDGFFVSPKLALGTAFTVSNHYGSVFELLQKKIQTTFDWVFFSSLEVKIGYVFLNRSIKLYAAGGVQFLPESTVQFLPVPTIQVGIIFYPARMAGAISRLRVNKAQPPKAITINR